MTEPEVVEGLVCDTSVSEFNSRQSLFHKMIARSMSAPALVLPGSRGNGCLHLIECYLQTTPAGSFHRVKLFELNVLPSQHQLKLITRLKCHLFGVGDTDQQIAVGLHTNAVIRITSSATITGCFAI